MENKITELLLSTDKALKELYINFAQYKDAKKIYDLQAKKQIIEKHDDYDTVKEDFENLKKDYDKVILKNSSIKVKISSLKNQLQSIIDKDKLDQNG